MMGIIVHVIGCSSKFVRRKNRGYEVFAAGGNVPTYMWDEFTKPYLYHNIHSKRCFMKKNKQTTLLIAMILFAFSAMASGGNSEPCLIQGHVMDAITKKPISGVVVSATAPGTNSPKEVITDAEGFFYFTQLPSTPATQVNLLFDKKGYQLYKRSCILAKEKVTLKINIEVLPEDIGKITDDSEYPLLRMFDAR